MNYNVLCIAATTTQELGTASPTQNTALSKDSSTTSPTTVPNLTATATKNHTGKQYACFHNHV